MKKTSIVVNSARKLVNMSVAGKMTMEDANLFLQDYKTKIDPIAGQQYDLVVDCTDMAVLTQDMVDNLTGVMKMYKETGFNQITYQIKENVVLKMQLNRIAKNAGLTNSQVVEV